LIAKVFLTFIGLDFADGGVDSVLFAQLDVVGIIVIFDYLLFCHAN
jgi:hypothetical protein